MSQIKSITIAITIMFGLSFNGQSQGFWEWGPHAPLTDSLSDNSNPFLFLTGYGYDAALLMFWEKRIDSLTTAIYMDNILDGDTAIPLVYEPGIQFTGPQIIRQDFYSGSDTSFFLIYASNQNSNADIYCKASLKDGSFQEPVALTSSPDDEEQFTTGREEFWWDNNAYVRNLLAYIRNDSLFVMNLMLESGNIYFDEEMLIDGQHCSNPVGAVPWGSNGLTYLKSDTGEFHIYQAVRDNYGSWGPPEIVYDSADCRNINRALHWGDLIWSAYRDSSWRIMGNNYWGNYMYDISKETPFDPAALGLVIGVKSWFSELWIATPYSENDTDEIFMTRFAGNPDFEDFTISGVQNRNPQFYMGEPESFSCWYDYLVWESYRNGHWQIWCSKVIQCAGGIKDNESRENFITSHPNPFTHETTLEFTLNSRSDVSIDIYNNSGLYISTLANKSFDAGSHQLRWNADGMAAGMYMVKLRVGDRIYTSKLVKNE